MKDWFESLEARERMFVSGGAVIVVIALLYGFVWFPLDSRHEELRQDASMWQKSLADLRPLRGSAVSNTLSGAANSIDASQSPIIIVDGTLQSRGLARYLRRSQPTSTNGVRVEFQDVAFDELVLWLGDLSRQYGMDVQAGSFSPGNQSAPGRINATLTLERPL